MGNCFALEGKRELAKLEEASACIRKVSDSNSSSNCDIISEFVKQCKILTKCDEIRFFYSVTFAKRNNSQTQTGTKYFGIGMLKNYLHFLEVEIQGLEFGKLGYRKKKISRNEKHLKPLLVYTTQLIERNHLRALSNAVLSVVESRRTFKFGSNIIDSISRTIRSALHCGYVGLFKVDPSTQIITELYPFNDTIHTFDRGILGHVALKKHFIVFNNQSDKVNLGIADLEIEVNCHGREGAVCVPIFGRDSTDICGILLATKTMHLPFTYLDVDLLQIVGIGIGSIIQKSATKLLFDDARKNNEDRATISLLNYYRESNTKSAILSAIIGDKPQRLEREFKRLSLSSSGDKRCNSNLSDEAISNGLFRRRVSSTVGTLQSISRSRLRTNSISITPPQSFTFVEKPVTGDLMTVHRSSLIRRASAPGSQSISSKKQLQQMENLQFDPFLYDIEHLQYLVYKIFDDLDIINGLKIPVLQFTAFIQEISGLYNNNNPYHNIYHGVSVLSFSYSFIKKTELHNNASIGKLDIFCILISSLCHDVDHPGNSNAFEIDTNSELAIMYNDRSVLENHHLNVTFRTLYKEKYNFIAHFSDEDKKLFRKRIIGSVLATDMSRHFQLCSDLDQIDVIQFEENLLNKKNDKLIQMICNIFTHTADVTAPCTQLLHALRWAKKICKEFTNQVEKEKELGINSLPMMIGLQNVENFLKSQCNFYKFVLHPLFKSVARLWPQLKFVYLQLLNNEQYFIHSLKEVQYRQKMLQRQRSVSIVAPISAAAKIKQIRRSSIQANKMNPALIDVFVKLLKQ